MLMRARQRGFTLVELMVTLVILGVLLAAAAPNFGPWIAGTRIRSTAEGIIAGLQYAKSEATTRNSQVRFQLTSTLDATCVRSVSGNNWVVDAVDADPAVDSVENQCNAAPSDTVAPSILQTRSANEVGRGVLVTSSASQVIFNGLGRQAAIAPAAAPALVTIDITPTSTSGTCAASGGKVTCLRILVNPTCQVRMCNPTAPAGDPQSC